MKAVVVYSPTRIEVEEFPLGELGDYECLVKIGACGFCNGTDLKLIENKADFHKTKYPTLLGHEHMGEIIALGEKVKNFRLGQRFLNPPVKTPEGMNSCWGGMSEYAHITDNKAMFEAGLRDSPFLSPALGELPPEISDEDACVILTLKENLSGIYNLGFEKGMDVLVYGDGPVAKGIIKFLELGGANTIVCAGHHDERLDSIAQLCPLCITINTHHQSVNKELGEKKFDLVIDGVGKTEIIVSGSQFLKSGGIMGVYGVIKKGDDKLNLYDLPNHTRVHMLTLPHKEHDWHDKVIKMIMDGVINPRDYYSHIIPVNEIKKAITMTRSRESLKVIISFKEV